MQIKQTPKKQFGIFEPTRVFLALLIAVLFFLVPISGSEDENTSKGKFHSLITVSCAGASDCPDPCKVWYCGNKIPGGPCLEWTYHCDGCEYGGGGTNQPPTISHTLTCTNTGVNDWCIGNLTLDLTAADPQGQTVIISGDLNGSNFTCPNGDTTCQVPLPEGAGTANYKVDSATGLSATGTTSYQLDATTPEITGGINASPGTNGWYTSQAFVSAQAVDAISGIAVFEASVDDGAWTAYADTTFSDGMHSITFRAIDHAGNVTETARQEIKVDTVTPVVNVSISGTGGANGWYSSQLEISVMASDALSGIAFLEAAVDGGAWTTVSGPLAFADGVHTVQFRASDHAGNITETAAQEFKVDATTPTLSLNVNGTKRENGWYVSHVSVTPNASDAGSGIHKVEAKVDSDQWIVISDQLPVFNDGVHTYQIKVTDHAGNVTETPALTLMVDTVPPAIAIYDDTLDLGDTLYYDLEDMGSGLWINRTVIEDDDEKYKKVVWLTDAAGQKEHGEIRWDGVFADGTRAAPGEYFITLKISDRAGNETMRAAVVKVTALSALIPIPTFTPPPSNLPLPLGEDVEEETPLEFGGTNNGHTGGEVGTLAAGGEAAAQGETGWTSAGASFSSGNQSAHMPSAASNILWGAAAAAALGMTLADWQRKREEEAAARLAAERANEVPDDVLAKRRAKVMAKNQAQRAQERAWEQARQAQNAKPEIDEDTFMQKTYKKILNTANVIPGVSAWREKQEEQAKQNAVSAARWAGVASVAQGKQEEENKTSWWENWGKPVLTNVADFMSGVVYQVTIKNNLDPLMAIAPAPKDVKNGWNQSWTQLEIDSTAFIAGRIVGGIVGIVQGVWEMVSGVATGTGGTVVSCGTVVLCVGGGGVSIAAGSALVTHGFVVAANSAYQTGQQIQALMSTNGQNNTGGGRPGNNIAQNRQFDGAIREIEKQIGRKLTKNEMRQLHDSLHHLENPGYWDIVEEGLNLFGE
jgi:hypothetical protein